ncbi:MAG TPA: hypothetical protein VFC00_33025, partial [Micromonosporaceae bacterium]|nr:hypothetical protein [Micromonosporaceae bacterium]
VRTVQQSPGAGHHQVASSRPGAWSVAADVPSELRRRVMRALATDRSFGGAGCWNPSVAEISAALTPAPADVLEPGSVRP